MLDLKGTALADQTAWAKINLTLQVTGRRDDGYHALSSLVVFAEHGDVLRFQESDVLNLTIDGPFAAGLSAAADNLVLRAAEGFSALAGRPLNVAVTLIKNLPVAAGIGGGSADAAAVLRGLCSLTGLSPDDPSLLDLALQLGADVPVCLAARTVVMSGIGEVLRPVVAFPALALVLVNPGVPLSTAAVFKARQPAFSRADEQLPPPDFDTLLDWLGERPNDLEEAARRLSPVVPRVLDSLAATPGCRLARMSGSGATCFAIYENHADAESAALALRGAEPGWWVTATGLRAG
ncbi:4-(cytidine 5'-diphospho)-2-C-methyl-D-erythritol kinase [Pelagibius litoralis]|uniref:4-diphosphocytidyl-2-C-methyl-D-erythritol kinase n=1 Tax=Pelagibius litoralis TaxID=374515 RepID=A0A967F1Z8_9PROT|nr:4-(cytidine 5'-diphospho)-2-C-methyl-D-erythritol kinase [Pelagibius litoralis]NIA71615.1 4-(cytidine 5'-diphospho)-2-C-methyl-D-erythritol kinase [Pelagibius litoralis]